jgi:hypothetical protein
MMTLLIFGSLMGDICIVLTPRNSSIPNVPPEVREKPSKKSGVVPDRQKQLGLF